MVPHENVGLHEFVNFTGKKACSATLLKIGLWLKKDFTENKAQDCKFTITFYDFFKGSSFYRTLVNGCL